MESKKIRDRKRMEQGKEIREIRKKLGVTQTAFAYLLNISFSTLNRWENGQVSTDEEIYKRLQGLKELLNQKDIDKEKVQESIKTVGIANAVTIGAVAGLISSPAMAVLLSPVTAVGAAGVGVASILSKLFLKNGKK